MRAAEIDQALGDGALSQGLIDARQLRYAQLKCEAEHIPLARVLVELGFLTQGQVARELARLLDAPYVAEAQLPRPSAEALALFNRATCINRGFLPLAREGMTLLVALGDARQQELGRYIETQTGLAARYVQSEFDAVTRAARQHYYFAENPLDSLLAREVERLTHDVDRVHTPEKLLDLLLHVAVRERATDLHLAPTAGSRSVLLRIDGVLEPMLALPPALDRLVGYIKLRAGMDVAETRLPQDGGFTHAIYDLPYSLRVSSLIGESGERIVMRLLAERSQTAGLQELGFEADDLHRLRDLFARPQGLVLMTGPTGSGKSTTLHAALRMQSLVTRNVLTVEDPVEYRVPLACQTELNRKAGYDFARALRHFLRHDPDVILLGEVRDPETAVAAIDAASTGHLVLSTLHVGSILGVVPRLRMLGADPESIAENLVGVINQRLVRRLCPHCRRIRPVLPHEAQWLGPQAREVHEAAGCEHCRHTGYKGRVPVYEVLAVDTALRNAIADGASRRELGRIAHASGMRPLDEHARLRVLRGDTTTEEIVRVLGTLEAPGGQP